MWIEYQEENLYYDESYLYKSDDDVVFVIIKCYKKDI